MNNIIPYTDLKRSALHAFDFLDVSENTKQDYQNRIYLFLKHIRKVGFDQNSYLTFKHALRDRSDLSVSTKNKYLITSRVLLKELHRQGVVPDITSNIKTFSQDKKHKRVGLTEKEIDILVTYLKELESNAENTRLKAIFGLLLFQGLRQIEISRITVEDVSLPQAIVFIQGKGRDDKEMIHLHPMCVSLLSEYIDRSNLKSGFLFPSRIKNKALTTRAIRGFVKEILNQLGIQKSTHGFRHFFTSKLIKTYKGDLLEVAQYTRHKGLEMLQVYNDSVKKEADLPRFYNTFKGVSF